MSLALQTRPTIKLETVERGDKTYDQIRFFICGLWFYHDIHGERDLRLAERLARVLGTEVFDCRRALDED